MVRGVKKQDASIDRVVANGGVAVLSFGEVRTALHGYEPIKRSGCELSELPLSGKLSIRANIAKKSVASRVVKGSGLAIPRACSFTSSKRSSAMVERLLWLGPDELLLYCDLAGLAEVEGKLFKNLSKQHHSLVDVSDYYTVLRLSGAGSQRLLNSECPLDLRLSSFPVGRCAGTIFGHAMIVLMRVGVDIFEIQVRWSFAEYLWSHLSDGLKFI